MRIIWFIIELAVIVIVLFSIVAATCVIYLNTSVLEETKLGWNVLPMRHLADCMLYCL